MLYTYIGANNHTHQLQGGCLLHCTHTFFAPPGSTSGSAKPRSLSEKRQRNLLHYQAGLHLKPAFFFTWT